MASRWGSLLSQAVAGVEARLDNILSEEEQAKQHASSRQSSRQSSAASSPKPSPRTAPASTKSANDRLQERLARAVATKNAAAANQRTEASPVALSRNSIEGSSANRSPRPSSDFASADSSVASTALAARTSLSKDDTNSVASGAEPVEEMDQVQPGPQRAVAETTLGSPRLSTNRERPDFSDKTSSVSAAPKEELVAVPQSTSENIKSSVALYESRVRDLEQALEDARLQHQEELHTEVEQVDALQAKLKYLAREAVESAKQSASSAPAGSLEKKLAERDQQVAQLMEEGQKLAGNEQKLRTVIKNLRAQIAKDEKEINEQKLWRLKTEAELDSLREATRSSSESQKANDESQKVIANLRKDLDRLKSTVSSQDEALSELRERLRDETEKVVEAKANEQASQAAHQKIKELEDTVATLEVEKNLVADRARVQATQLQEKAERAIERTRVVELDLKSEIQALEGKLEAFRVRAEEASSGAVGDAQAKLLRQIETLQTQYSIASENWQGMEASLAARAAGLEKERDDALRRESEMRKKAREIAARSKRQEEELEEARCKLPSVQKDLSDQQQERGSLRKRAEEAEAALAAARADFEKQRLTWKEEMREKSTLDRRTWLEEAALRNTGPPESPGMYASPRTYSGDNYLGLQSFPAKLRKPSAPSSAGDPNERPAPGRKASQQTAPSRQTILSIPSAQSVAAPSMAGGEQMSQYARRLERHDSFDDTPASPHHVLQDMMSVSTVAAGPSVQMVERMSAAVRRLESEKIAAKGELARISGQRDEARSEIVALMKEVESNKAAVKRAKELEREVAEINERYQNTLELLGENKELVDELRADVADLKEMYRDLVERTVKEADST